MGAASAAVALACFVCFVSTGGVRNHLDLVSDDILITGINNSSVLFRKGIARGQEVQTGMVFVLIAQPFFKGAPVHAGGAMEADTVLKCNVVQFQVHL